MKPQNADARRDERALLLRLDVLQFLASIAVWMAAFYIAILGKGLGLPDYEIGVVAIVYGLSLLFSNYFCGSLSDVYGARLFLIIGFLFSSIMFIVHVFVFDYMSLLWVRLITGVALGIYPGALYAIAHATRTRMGKFSSFGAMGSFVGLAGAGFISAAYGTRSLFLVGAIVLFAAFILALQVRGTNGSSERLSLRPTLTIRQNLSIYTSLLTRHTGANMVWTF